MPATAVPATATSPWAPPHRALMTGMVTLIALSAFEALAVTTVMAPFYVKEGLLRLLGGVARMGSAGPGSD